MDQKFACSISDCFLIAIWSDGKDQWCDLHVPSPEDREKFDIRLITQEDVFDE